MADSIMYAAPPSVLAWAVPAWIACAAFAAGILLPLCARLPVRSASPYWLIVAAIGGPLTILFLLGSFAERLLRGPATDGD